MMAQLITWRQSLSKRFHDIRSEDRFARTIVHTLGAKR
jgi:hypothetical protein